MPFSKSLGNDQVAPTRDGVKGIITEIGGAVPPPRSRFWRPKNRAGIQPFVPIEATGQHRIVDAARNMENTVLNEPDTTLLRNQIYMGLGVAVSLLIGLGSLSESGATDTYRVVTSVGASLLPNANITDAVLQTVVSITPAID